MNQIELNWMTKSSSCRSNANTSITFLFLEFLFGFVMMNRFSLNLLMLPLLTYSYLTVCLYDKCPLIRSLLTNSLNRTINGKVCSVVFYLYDDFWWWWWICSLIRFFFFIFTSLNYWTSFVPFEASSIFCVLLFWKKKQINRLYINIKMKYLFSNL